MGFLPNCEIPETTCKLPFQEPWRSDETICECPVTYFRSFTQETVFSIIFQDTIHTGLFMAVISTSFFFCIATPIFFPKIFKHTSKIPTINSEMKLATILSSVIILCLFIANQIFDDEFWPNGCAQETHIYHQMFCEPTYYGNLVRRPMNTYSNVMYYWCAIYVFLTFRKTKFPAVDLLFACTLFVLAIASTMWHASNCLWVHYLDLGTMNGVIAWGALRGIFSAFNNIIERNVAFIVYLVTVLYFLLSYYKHYQVGTFDHQFPSGDVRLANNEIDAMEIIFGHAMAPVYLNLTTMLLVFTKQHMGNIWLNSISCVFLHGGWWLHLAENWAGNIFCIPDTLLQNTGVFHLMTGTLLAMHYMNVHIIDTLSATGGTKLNHQD